SSDNPGKKIFFTIIIGYPAKERAHGMIDPFISARHNIICGNIIIHGSFLKTVDRKIIISHIEPAAVVVEISSLSDQDTEIVIIDQFAVGNRVLQIPVKNLLPVFGVRGLDAFL